jgi:hypothetical protein
MYYAPVLQYYYKYAEFVPKYFCNSITKLHNVINWFQLIHIAAAALF